MLWEVYPFLNGNRGDGVDACRDRGRREEGGREWEERIEGKLWSVFKINKNSKQTKFSCSLKS